MPRFLLAIPDNGAHTMSEPVGEPEAAADASTPAPFDPNEIIAELDRAHGRLPRPAIGAAREHRDVMVPLLIKAIQDATAKVRKGEKVEGNAHFFALFMLTEFRAKEALPAILEAISLPGEGPSDLFADAITTALAGILATLSDDPLTLADSLLRNRDLYEYVRWEAAQMYLHLVRSGRLSRAEAVEHLREHLRHTLDEAADDPIAPLRRAMRASSGTWKTLRSSMTRSRSWRRGRAFRAGPRPGDRRPRCPARFPRAATRSLELRPPIPPRRLRRVFKRPQASASAATTPAPAEAGRSTRSAVWTRMSAESSKRNDRC